MTITHNTDYSTITIQSDLLATPWSGIHSVTLLGRTLCVDNNTDTIVEGDITESSFTVDLETVFSTTTLADGIYTFILSVSNDDETVDVEYGCLFVDNETKCLVANAVKDCNNISLQLDYYLLTKAQDCDCDCDDLCTIYRRMTNELDCSSC